MKLTLEQCRQMLGNEAEGMTDKEVEELRDTLTSLAHTLIDSYLRERGQPPNTEP